MQKNSNSSKSVPKLDDKLENGNTMNFKKKSKSMCMGVQKQPFQIDLTVFDPIKHTQTVPQKSLSQVMNNFLAVCESPTRVDSKIQQVLIDQKLDPSEKLEEINSPKNKEKRESETKLEDDFKMTQTKNIDSPMVRLYNANSFNPSDLDFSSNAKVENVMNLSDKNVNHSSAFLTSTDQMNFIPEFIPQENQNLEDKKHSIPFFEFETNGLKQRNSSMDQEIEDKVKIEEFENASNVTNLNLFYDNPSFQKTPNLQDINRKYTAEFPQVGKFGNKLVQSNTEQTSKVPTDNEIWDGVPDPVLSTDAIMEQSSVAQEFFVGNEVLEEQLIDNLHQNDSEKIQEGIDYLKNPQIPDLSQNSSSIPVKINMKKNKSEISSIISIDEMKDFQGFTEGEQNINQKLSFGPFSHSVGMNSKGGVFFETEKKTIQRKSDNKIKENNDSEMEKSQILRTRSDELTIETHFEENLKLEKVVSKDKINEEELEELINKKDDEFVKIIQKNENVVRQNNDKSKLTNDDFLLLETKANSNATILLPHIVQEEKQNIVNFVNSTVNTADLIENNFSKNVRKDNQENMQSFTFLKGNKIKKNKSLNIVQNSTFLLKKLGPEDLSTGPTFSFKDAKIELKQKDFFICFNVKKTAIREMSNFSIFNKILDVKIENITKSERLSDDLKKVSKKTDLENFKFTIFDRTFANKPKETRSSNQLENYQKISKTPLLKKSITLDLPKPVRVYEFLQKKNSKQSEKKNLNRHIIFKHDSNKTQVYHSEQSVEQHSKTNTSLPSEYNLPEKISEKAILDQPALHTFLNLQKTLKWYKILIADLVNLAIEHGETNFVALLNDLLQNFENKL